MRAILPTLAIVAALVLGMTLVFPEHMRSAGDNGTLFALIQSTMVAILIGAGLFGSRGKDAIGLRQGLVFGAIWVGLGLFLVAAYSQRDGFLRLWSSITGEINPSQAQVIGHTTVLRKSGDGHFWAEVAINGKTIRMMVDTGASQIALDQADARRAGIDLDNLKFDVPISTAAGPSKAAGVQLDTVSLGPIVRDNVPASVMVTTGGVSLLGMSFLAQLSSVNLQGDTLTLTD